MVINHFQLAKLLFSKYLQDNKRGELSNKRNTSKSEIRNKGGFLPGRLLMIATELITSEKSAIPEAFRDVNRTRYHSTQWLEYSV